MTNEIIEYPRDTAVTSGNNIREAIGSLLPDWVRYLAEEEGSPGDTVTTYAKGVERFINWLADNPQPITKLTFITYRNELGREYSPATVNLSVTAVRRFLDWLVITGEIPFNPAIGVKSLRIKNKNKVHKRDRLTTEEVRAVLALPDRDTAEGARDYAILCAMLYAGLRQVEIHRSRIEGYRTRGEYRVLWVTGKGSISDDNFMVVNPVLERALANWLAYHPRGEDPEAPLFCSLSRRSYGKPLSTSHIRRLVKGYFKEAGIRDSTKTTHSLRHTAISKVAKERGLFKAQIFARHTDPKVTEIYLHDLDRLEDPAEFAIEY